MAAPKKFPGLLYAKREDAGDNDGSTFLLCEEKRNDLFTKRDERLTYATYALVGTASARQIVVTEEA